MTNGMTRRTAVVLVVLMMIAVPATAAVITQNFMRADVNLSAACFTKTAGADALGGSDFVTFTECNGRRRRGCNPAPGDEPTCRASGRPDDLLGCGPLQQHLRPRDSGLAGLPE